MTKYLLLIVSMALLLLTACGGGDKDNNYNPSNKDKTVLTTPSAGRLLASQCAQCHGTDGISVSRIDSLAGESGEILEEMFEMKGRTRNRVMHLQAKGYSNAEIREIANYFSKLYQNNGGGSNNGEDSDDNDSDNGGDDNDDNNNDGDDNNDDQQDGDDD